MDVTIPCVCPPLTSGGPRHESDTVTLSDVVPWKVFAIVRNAMVLNEQTDERLRTAEVMADLAAIYLEHGVTDWSLVDQRNKHVDVSRDAIRAFMEVHPVEALTVADVATGIYQKAVVDPLVQMASRSSQRTPTDGSMSQLTDSPATPRRRRKPSSITTSQMDGTVTMYASHGGGSSS